MKYLVLVLVLLGLVGCKSDFEHMVSVDFSIVDGTDIVMGVDGVLVPTNYHYTPASNYTIRYMSMHDYYAHRKGNIRFWSTWHPDSKIHIGTKVFKVTDYLQTERSHCEEALVFNSPTTVYVDFRTPREPCPE